MNPFLEDVESDREFFVVDGARLRNLEELALFLDAVEDNHFFHHVTLDRNDFAVWVSDAVGDVELGDELMKKHTAYAMAKSVKKRIRELQNPPKAKRKLEPYTSKAREFAYGIILGYVIGMFVARLLLGGS
ncbi:MAG: hypothetical protein ABIH34_03195 [Nanoarchaeota archaeon]